MFVMVVALGAPEEGELARLHRDIMQLFEQPFTLDGREIAVTVKCGFAFHPENGRDSNELVQNAEAALKEAKTSGEPYLHHRVEMNSALAARVRMEHRLRAALGNNQFELHYQPKLQLRSGKIEAAEALLRWRDPERGLVPPASFLPYPGIGGVDACRWGVGPQPGRVRLSRLAPRRVTAGAGGRECLACRVAPARLRA